MAVRGLATWELALGPDAVVTLWHTGDVVRVARCRAGSIARRPGAADAGVTGENGAYRPLAAALGSIS